MTAAIRHLALALSLLFIGTGTAAATFRPAVFSPAKSFPVGRTPVSVAMGEFNRDGRADLVVANSGSRTITLLSGDGEGSFNSSQEIYVGQTPSALIVADVNADGRHDIAVVLKGENSIVIPDPHHRRTAPVHCRPTVNRADQRGVRPGVHGPDRRIDPSGAVRDHEGGCDRGSARRQVTAPPAFAFSLAVFLHCSGNNQSP